MSNLFDLTDEEYEKELDKYLPLDRRFTASSVNCFVMKMAEFLSGLAASAENGALQLERQLRTTDIKLRVLEEQLSLIELSPETLEGLKEKAVQRRKDDMEYEDDEDYLNMPGGVPGSSTAESSKKVEKVEEKKTTIEEKITSAVEEKKVVPVAEEIAEVVKVEEKPETVQPTHLPSTNAVLVKDDPEFSKYFKMLKMGVIEQAVKQKMQSEGVDPTLLSRGDEPSPNAQSGNANDSDSESISSFSDSD